MDKVQKFDKDDQRCNLVIKAFWNSIVMSNGIMTDFKVGVNKYSELIYESIKHLTNYTNDFTPFIKYLDKIIYLMIYMG